MVFILKNCSDINDKMCFYSKSKSYSFFCIYLFIVARVQPTTQVNRIPTSNAQGLQAINKTSSRTRRVRTAFTPFQLLCLETSFDKNHYVVGSERKQLASYLKLSETQVKVWFQNRRTKWKRQALEGRVDMNKDPLTPWIKISAWTILIYTSVAKLFRTTSSFSFSVFMYKQKIQSFSHCIITFYLKVENISFE